MNRRRKLSLGILLSAGIWILCLGQPKADKNLPPGPVRPPSAIFDPASPAKASQKPADIQTASGAGHWDNRFFLGGPNAYVLALAINGTEVYAGGGFTKISEVEFNKIAKWDGTSWSALGTGTDDEVRALAVSGTNLYAGGLFTTAGGVMVNRIAKWDGTSWSALGTGIDGPVDALAVSGANLYAGGWFTTAGGVTVNNIAKWDGTSWTTLRTGISGSVRALAVSGTDLYAGGHFTTDGGVTENYIVKWDGTSWSALGTGMDGSPFALAVSGTNLYVGGSFTAAGGVTINNFAKWNGSAWTAISNPGAGLSDRAESLLMSGTDLYAGGWFTTAGRTIVNRIAKWDGTSWSALGTGMDGVVNTLAVSGTDLYVGGYFTTAGGLMVNRIAKWDGTSWSALGTGMNSSVQALAVSGTNLYAAGRFWTAGGVSADGIAKWDGSSWSAWGTGMNGYVGALAVRGTDLYAGGDFTTAGGVTVNHIAKWDGTRWSALGTGMDGDVLALAVSGTDLYVGGYFTTAGGVMVNRIAKWDGTSWSALGTGMDGYVGALAVSGTNLYAGGNFATAGGVTANRIAKWDGRSWKALGSGTNEEVLALAGNASDLYVGGRFSKAGEIPSEHIAHWIADPLGVISPNGGETWLSGSTHDITWSTTLALANVKIEYSTDGGTSWTTITGSTANLGSCLWTVPNTPSTNCLVRISNAANAATSDVGDAVFTIANAPLPVIQLSRKALNFGAIQAGSNVSTSGIVAAGVATSAQKIIVSNSGGFTLNWTAVSDKGWLAVTPGSGTQAGILQVSVNHGHLVAGKYTGTIIVSDQNAANNPQTITVALTVIASGTSAVPFGDYATPIDGTTGITGAIPVTGWVLDDVETTNVRIYRDPVAGDPPGAISPNGLVFIGEGIFVDGARPDVEAIYTGFPLNYRAGWGYMLLTNFLPNQGNGTYKLYAIAIDRDGNTVTMGTKTIVCDNAHAVKPFGTIDTPAQGGETSGNPYLNFGWVLTPQPKTVPKDGSTIDVYVDGVKVGNLSTAPNVYNQYRVDVATAFPGLNNSGGPVGAFFLDTTKYADGVHMLSWVVTDDAGQADGIGSRYFSIFNTGEATLGKGDTYFGDMYLRDKSSICIPKAYVPKVADILNLPINSDPPAVKRGFDPAAPPETIVPDRHGVYHIDIREVELLRIFLEAAHLDQTGPAEGRNPPSPLFMKGGDEGKPTLRKDRIEGKSAAIDGGADVRYAGCMIVGDQLRPLPVGSTLDPVKGAFSWLPGPGFLGTYDLLFLKTDELEITRRIPVKVTIRPKFSRH